MKLVTEVYICENITEVVRLNYTISAQCTARSWTHGLMIVLTSTPQSARLLVIVRSKIAVAGLLVN